MKSKSTYKVILPVLISFYVMGFVDIVGVATGYVKQDFNLSDGVAQLLPSMVFIWFALVSIPTSIYQARKGKKITVIIGMIITGLGLLVPFVIYSYITVVLGFVMLGVGNTILQVSANPLLIDVSSANAKVANLSLSQFIKAIASMLGPIITTSLVVYFGDWKLIFPIYAVLSVLSSIWLYSIKIDETQSEKSSASLATVILLLKNRFILIMIMSVFMMVGFDVAMNSNIANYLQTRFNIDLETASLGISIYFAALMVGRLAGAVMLRKLDAKYFLVISTLLTLLGLAGIIFVDDLFSVQILIFITGLGFANLFPIIFAITVESRPEYANEISGLIIFFVSGGAIIPPLMGLISQHYGVTLSFGVLVLCILYVGFAAWYALKSRKTV